MRRIEADVETILGSRGLRRIILEAVSAITENGPSVCISIVLTSDSAVAVTAMSRLSNTARETDRL